MSNLNELFIILYLIITKLTIFLPQNTNPSANHHSQIHYLVTTLKQQRNRYILHTHIKIFNQFTSYYSGKDEFALVYLFRYVLLNIWILCNLLWLFLGYLIASFYHLNALRFNEVVPSWSPNHWCIISKVDCICWFGMEWLGYVNANALMLFSGNDWKWLWKFHFNFSVKKYEIMHVLVSDGKGPSI